MYSQEIEQAGIQLRFFENLDHQQEITECERAPFAVTYLNTWVASGFMDCGECLRLIVRSLPQCRELCEQCRCINIPSSFL